VSLLFLKNTKTKPVSFPRTTASGVPSRATIIHPGKCFAKILTSVARLGKRIGISCLVLRLSNYPPLRDILDGRRDYCIEKSLIQNVITDWNDVTNYAAIE
jgi:hypothetical protein